MSDSIVQELKSFPVFENVPPDQLKWLIDNSEISSFRPDDILSKPGDDVTSMMILLSGEISVQLKRGERLQQMGSFGKGEIIGRPPFSRMQTTIAYLSVVEETTLLITHQDLFPEVAKHYQLIEAFVHSMSDRIRTFTSRVQQNEKLVALGKLSAGLAHELNNPASAMVRGATELRKRLRATPDKFKEVMNIRLTSDQVDAVNELVFRKAENGSSNHQSLMERTALEDELTDWMEDRGVEEGFDFANTFAEYCFNLEDLEFVNKHVDEKYLPAVLGWIEDVLTTEKMVEEIEDASRRISDLISSVKTYSHMDRGSDKEVVELKKLLKSTITMLNHKAKQKKVEIELSIPNDLPEFCGFVSELNQVWTNILDNAIDALPDQGRIEITAESKGDRLYLFFKDNGVGIPEDVKSRIFDPFFTTKDVGKGTGLGLDVVHKIVEKHEGEIKVHSKPGETIFELIFPLS
ncbi:MAG: ATP-binding protein [Balneolaceae bacterium]